MRSRAAVRGSGFTLVELLIVVAVAAVLLVIAAPGFRDFVLVQRLKAVNAQLVTDLQLARSEAAARGQWGRVVFERDTDLTCYTIYTAPEPGVQRCSCLLGAGSACTGDAREIKTVRVARSDNVTVIPVLTGAENAAIGFDHISGGLVVIPQDSAAITPDFYDIDTAIDSNRALRVRVGRSGRPTVCRAAGSMPGFDACP
jgi:type IV fimbrial biogenesis protein FimT